MQRIDSNKFFTYSYFLYINKHLSRSNVNYYIGDFKVYYSFSSYNYLKWLNNWYGTNSSIIHLYLFFKTISASINFTTANNLFLIIKSTISAKKFISDNITISKGPMARKKFSREQYAIKSYRTLVCIFVKFNFLTTIQPQNFKYTLLFKILNLFLKKKHFKSTSSLYLYFFFHKATLLFFQLETPLGNIVSIRID